MDEDVEKRYWRSELKDMTNSWWCRSCGAMVMDTKLHDGWHQEESR